ncbi:MAG: histidine kinase [Bacteroidota bacterium]|jgi:ligand-binding sensor domain-containing protein|nr:histidine kinase [Bacteroidota bacterium]
MKYCFLICWLLFSSYYSAAQNYSFNKYTLEDGLPQTYCFSLIQDSRGYMWVGTSGGLARFDGTDFKVFTERDGLSDNMVYSLLEDKKGNIWIGTANGLTRYNGKVFEKFLDSHSSLEKNVTSIIETSTGEIWIATDGGALKLADTNFVNPVDLKNVRAIVEDSIGQLWFGSKWGLFKYNGIGIEKYEIEGGGAINSIVHSARDKKNNLWFGTVNGLIKITGKGYEIFEQDGGVESVFRFILPLDDKIIFGTYGGGFKILENNTFSLVKPFEKLNMAGNTISGILETHDKTVWAATGAGLIKINSTPFVPFSLNNNHVKGNLLFQHNDIYYISTDTGLVKFNRNDFERVFLDKAKQVNHIVTCFTILNKKLVIGTYRGEVFIQENNEFELHAEKFHPLNNATNTLLIENERIWYGKQHSIIKYENGNYESFKLDTIHLSTFKIHKDRKGNIWFATDLSISIMDKLGNIKNHYTINGKKIKHCHDLCEDRYGNIWFTTFGNGLFRWNGKEFENFTVNEGLIDNYLQSILIENDNLWIGSSRGISKIKLNEKSEIVNIKNYGKSEGLTSLECIKTSAIIDETGNLIFGTANGFYQYYPKQDGVNSVPPKVALSKIKLFYKDVDLVSYSDSVNYFTNLPYNLSLAHNQNHITFDFRALSFHSLENVNYQWYLDGFDDSWSPITNKSEITYSNLPAGNFTLNVKAANSDGVWSKPFEVPFIIQPPFWLRWWFLTLAITGVLLLILLLFKFQIKRIQREERKKSESLKRYAELELKALRSQLNPHFMFNVLNSIQEVIVSKEDEKALVYLADFAALMRTILDNSTHKFITLEKELEFLHLYLNMEKLRFEDKFETEFEVDKELDLTQAVMPPMLMQPYIENAIKHGLTPKNGKGNLKIKFVKEDTGILCIVEDNGVGRKKAKEIISNGNSKGMTINSERLQVLNSFNSENNYSITIEDLTKSGIPLGTRIKINIPLTVNKKETYDNFYNS